MYFLDTNTCIYFLNGRYPGILRKFEKISANEIMIPSIVLAELLYGAEKSEKKESNQRNLERFSAAFKIAGFDSEAAVHYSEIRASLESSGIPIGPNDLLIAAIVRAQNGILVTHNTKEFSRVPGLHIEDWTI
jgi:tRNA(fMet)-specific endonuclease VapC